MLEELNKIIFYKYNICSFFFFIAEQNDSLFVSELLFIRFALRSVKVLFFLGFTKRILT